MNQNCNADSVNPSEMINYIFKKQFGLPNIFKTDLYSEEGNDISSYKPTTTDLLFSQYIPPNPPRDLIRVPFCNINIFSNLPGQAKFISSNYPYLGFYSNIFMNPIGASGSNAFAVSTGLSNILTKNCIPFTYGINGTNSTAGNNYKTTIKITASNGTTNLNFGTISGGSWLFDTDSGIVTFYDTPTAATVNRTTPPRISFWRYEGLIGNNTIMNIADF